MRSFITISFLVLFLSLSFLRTSSGSNKFVCPVTLPDADQSFWYQNRYAHHNEVLAVYLYTTGSRVIGQSGAWMQDDGYIHSKYPWVKKVAGELTVSGKRLNGESRRPFIANYPSFPNNPPGEVPGGFLLPEAGCWKITGNLAGKDLSFVINIISPENK